MYILDIEKMFGECKNRFPFNLESLTLYSYSPGSHSLKYCTEHRAGFIIRLISQSSYLLELQPVPNHQVQWTDLGIAPSFKVPSLIKDVLPL
jgi:hypothetical protein